MALSVGTARHPVHGVRTPRSRRRRRNSLGAVAVGADGEATLAARPVYVEQRGIARVTHLSHALDRSLPYHFRR